MSDSPITLLYDTATHRVGCVLLQAAFNCDSQRAYLFPTSRWCYAPTDTMQRITGTLDQWQRLVQRKETP